MEIAPFFAEYGLLLVFGVVLVEFQYEKDLQEATQDIRDKINSIRNDLPEEMKEPILTKVNPTDMPIVSLALSSKTMPVEQLTLIADPPRTIAALLDGFVRLLD